MQDTRYTLRSVRLSLQSSSSELSEVTSLIQTKSSSLEVPQLPGIVDDSDVCSMMFPMTPPVPVLMPSHKKGYNKYFLGSYQERRQFGMTDVFSTLGSYVSAM